MPNDNQPWTYGQDIVPGVWGQSLAAVVAAATLASCATDRGPLSNRMGQTSTAYLSGAAQHPVAWQPWGREAFALAARLDRPLLLFIGADDCGSCVRMDQESYTDGIIGAVIDSHFVAVRVDRDERPDLARHYQGALQSLAGLRGYPVTLFLLPDGSPFFGGTYFPRDDPLTGRGLRQILPEVARSYRDQRDIIRRHAALARQLSGARSAAAHGVVRADMVQEEVRAVVRTLGSALGDQTGGGDRARADNAERLATFPYGQAIGVLLGEYARFRDTLALQVARAALAAIGSSGTRQWSDLLRALLLRNLTLAWLVTGEEQWREAALSLGRSLSGTVGGANRPVFADREAYVAGSLIESGRALGDSGTAESGRWALNRLLERLYEPGRGVRHAVVGSVSGLLQDQVQVASAVLASYHAFGSRRYLEVAQDIAAVLDRDFADPVGGYFDAAEPDPVAPALADRSKQVLDDLLPGANAWAAYMLVRLAGASGRESYGRRAEAALAAFAGTIRGENVRAASYLIAAREVLERRPR